MIRIESYGKDWEVRESEAERELVLTTPISTVRVEEKNGMLVIRAQNAITR
jgi:hypothetical protein